MLFAIAVNPFLRKFKAEVEDTGSACVRACADDVGGALKGIETLITMEHTFDMAQRCAGLYLKPMKCVIVPTFASYSDALAQRITEWLTRYLPQWSAFKVKDASKYLGVLMGPAAGAKQYVHAQRKWRDRARAIAGTHSSALVSAHLYNTRAIPVLGFLPQLTVIPSTLLAGERHVISHVLHFATSALDEKAAFTLNELGGPQIRSLKAMAIATIVRTAIKTLPEVWKENVVSLEANHEWLPGTSLISGLLWQDFWDSPACAVLLASASDGFADSRRYQSLGIDRLHPLNRNILEIRQTLAKILKDIKRKPALRNQVQKIVYDKVCCALYPSGLKALCAQRLDNVFGEPLASNDDFDWRPAAAVLKRAGVHTATVYIKTVLNSWTTSARYHDEKCRKCIFGCRWAGDELQHYVSCARLWTEVDVATGLDEEKIDTVQQRLMLSEPSRSRARRLTIAFSIYHALKLEALALIQAAEACGEYSAVITKLHALARTFANKYR
jgi:hypothetical protein